MPNFRNFKIIRWLRVDYFTQPQPPKIWQNFILRYCWIW